MRIRMMLIIGLTSAALLTAGGTLKQADASSKLTQAPAKVHFLL